MLRKFLLAALILASSAVFAQQADTVLLKQLLEAHPEYFNGILMHPQHNEVQIIYTQINRYKNNSPHFKTYTYRLNPQHYFYPASTVKLPTLIFALEKANRLHIKGLKNADMLTDSAWAGQTKVDADTSSATGKPSMMNYIKKILLVSDNDAYNRLYEFVGRKEINEKLKKYHLDDTRIVGRLAVGDGGENAKHTNPINFYRNGKLVYKMPAQYDDRDYPMQLENMLQGKGYIDRNNQLVMQPFDFSQLNVYSLADQQKLLRMLLFPEAFPVDQRFDLTEDDYKLICKYMSMYPTESRHPDYPQPEYYPAYCKFLFYGGDSLAVINPDIRIFNKVGDSYGYNIDNAYIVDFKNHVEFMLTAVIQSNEDGIFNDNKYEYKTVCLPFLKHLAEVIYQEELKRPKKYKPVLSKFKFSY